MSANSITSSDIVLVKWNGNSWVELETRVLSKDDTNTFFEGKTIAFSPFAITAKEVGVKSIDKVPGTEIPQQPGVTVTVTVQVHNETLQRLRKQPLLPGPHRQGYRHGPQYWSY